MNNILISALGITMLMTAIANEVARLRHKRRTEKKYKDYKDTRR